MMRKWIMILSVLLIVLAPAVISASYPDSCPEDALKGFMNNLAVGMTKNEILSYFHSRVGVWIALDGIEPGKCSGKLAIVLDDAGADEDTVSNIISLKQARIPVTISVLPKTPYAAESFDILASDREAEVMLHQPMEPTNGLSRDTDPLRDVRIYVDDTPEDALSMLLQNYNWINTHLSGKQLVGINNHEGSKITSQSTEILKTISSFAADKHLVILDSSTSSNTQFYKLAQSEIGRAHV